MASTAPAILAVEDAFLVGLQLKRYLEALGFEVVGPAAPVAEAIELLDHPGLALGVLDINLGAEDSIPIAQALRDRDIPLLFISGYDSVAREPFEEDTVLRKPSTPAKIAKAIAAIIPLPESSSTD